VKTHRPETWKTPCARLPRVAPTIPAPIPSPSRIACFRTTALTWKKLLLSEDEGILQWLSRRLTDKCLAG
jgi:hypothetical protein